METQNLYFIPKSLKESFLVTTQYNNHFVQALNTMNTTKYANNVSQGMDM